MANNHLQRSVATFPSSTKVDGWKCQERLSFTARADSTCEIFEGVNPEMRRGNELKTYKLCHVERYDLAEVMCYDMVVLFSLRVTTTKLILKPKWIKLKEQEVYP